MSTHRLDSSNRTFMELKCAILYGERLTVFQF